MGEWSKKIGEYGEDVVEKFLSIIGWNNPAKGVQIECLNKNGEHEKEPLHYFPVYRHFFVSTGHFVEDESSV